MALMPYVEVPTINNSIYEPFFQTIFIWCEQADFSLIFFAMWTNICTQLRNIFRMIKVIPFDFHFLHHNLFLLCTPIKRTVESRYEHCVREIVRWGTGKIFQGQISNMVLYPLFSLYLSFSNSKTLLAIYTHLLCRFALEIQNAMSFFPFWYLLRICERIGSCELYPSIM